VENGDGSKVNCNLSKGKVAEDIGPDEIGRLFKDPEF
jgi:hypothetical protein